jgi:hypothetical protein
VGNIDLKVISAIANSNKFQKPGFGRKIQLKMKLASLPLIVELRLLIPK